MKSLLVALVAVLFPAIALADPPNVYGVLLSEAQDGLIEISDCGDATPCGALIWIDPAKSPTDTDARNRDQHLRDRALIGVPIVWGYKYSRSEWRGGQIYNPEDGKTFKSSMKRLADGTLKVKGCLGPICISNIWTPVREEPNT